MSIEIDNMAWRETYEDYCKDHISSDELNLQNVFTPYELCEDMIHRLQVYCPIFKDLKFGVFNLEFADILMYDCGVSGEQITFITDCKSKSLFAESERYSGVNIEVINYMDLLNKKGFAKEKNMKFDVIVMNPPFQAPTNRVDDKGFGSRKTLWQHFVKLAFDQVKPGGYVCAIHPPRWRKPNDSAKDIISDKNGLLFLSIHTKEDGLKTFGCGTRFDWYIAKKTNAKTITTIRCEDDHVIKMNIKGVPFIPNKNIDFVLSLIAKENDDCCELLYSFSKYETRKKWMSIKKDNTFKYPCVHSTGKRGQKFYYSSINDNGMFGIPKIIFGDGGADTGICNPVVDINGEYGQTQHAIGIKIDPSQAKQIEQALTSNEFTKKIIHSCKWSNFEIEHETFKYLRSDFWKGFV